MTHMLPPHANIDLAQSSLQSALQIDPNHQIQQQQSQHDDQQQPQGTRKRKKGEGEGDAVHSPAEPRRLRRSHEACARCRSKKIKCDSKHPRCTACATAGVPCQQEDRHRQTLTPRGHTERLERQIMQCDALLKRHLPGFDLGNIEEILIRENVQVPGVMPEPPPGFQYVDPPQSGPSNSPYPPGPPPPPGQGMPPKGFPYPPPQHMVPPGYPHMPPMHYGPPPPGSPYPPPPHMGMPGPPPPGYNPHIHPAFQHPMGPHPNQNQNRPQGPNPDIKGQDPNANDMSSTHALAKSFGVSAAIVNDLKIAPGVVDLKEDLAVGSTGLTSGRDRESSSVPRDAAKWMPVPVRRNSIVSATTSAPATPFQVWLPIDRNMVKYIVDIYFTRLNPHRPVFLRHEFETTLNALYDRQPVQHDPGFVSGLYLMLALGTLSELSHKVSDLDMIDGGVGKESSSPTIKKKLMPADWPEHEDFFDRALVVKPELRVTVSSLQSLILLHWYLFAEGQGRTLWRLVGSMVRLAIELGLHHDPTTQQHTFTEEECQLRIRLWGIVMVHDRGTSLLLGRPLAISPSDSNTPRTSRAGRSFIDVSEHFIMSGPIAEIQADIINSLYSPTRQSAPDAIIRHATRIIKSMVEFRKGMPDSYKWYFSGTEDWPMDRRIKLVQDITEDQGLTLLKIGISRILLLRALFSSKELDYPQRYKALVDAIVTSHNVIVVHNQLIRFPDIAFFVSPIPLHIAAMVILYGHMSKCERLTRQVALEDVWMALDMLPRFRWRWERKDLTSGHPLIAKLAEKVLEVNLHQVGPPSHPVLMSDQDWENDGSGMLSPALSSGGVSNSGGGGGGGGGGGHGSQQQGHPVQGHPQQQQQQQHQQQQQVQQQKQGIPGTSTPYPGYPSQPGSNGNSNNNSPGNRPIPAPNPTGMPPPDKRQLVDVHPSLFYPLYPDPSQGVMQMQNGHGVNNNMPGNNGSGNNGGGVNGGMADINGLLAAAAGAATGGGGVQPIGPYGCVPSQETYMLEEKDGGSSGAGVQMWMNMVGLGALR
ncbi:hypothetical protein JAAARDRAFT_72641 [Jaapia argillacea MUCL 33604]|uniref:Zn(2)-C6 fungal-type domain-containing protein n=1 Tax=Jaapia argillacea MUCL 33604 TaxID=933084 RepID=A0A067PDW0_9AGAM|nr:hypothetical protein JAAARDRAFT_72641 [Jaapia argillacea MUCL 33604]